MQRDEGLEKKLKQLKEAYDNQPQRTNTERLVSQIYSETGAYKKKRKRKFLPAITAVAVAAIVGVLIVATPELLESPQNATEQNESAQVQNDRDMALHENEALIKEDAFVVDRDETKTDTINIEGMPEEMTFILAQSEQLRISTYYPEDMISDVTDDKMSFFANFMGEKYEAAYIEIYGANSSIEEMLASFSDYEVTKKQQVDFFVPLSEEEYTIIKGDLVGIVSLFERSGMLFRIIIHYPVEYGDGFDPRASKIISELQFH